MVANAKLLRLGSSHILDMVSRTQCLCKDWMSAAMSGDPNALHALVMKPCSCGSGIKKCSTQAHIAALDAYCAALEATKSYRQAFIIATVIIGIAPGRTEVSLISPVT